MTLFLPKYEANIVKIFALYCATLQGRNPHKNLIIRMPRGFRVVNIFSSVCTSISRRKKLNKTDPRESVALKITSFFKKDVKLTV